MRQEYHVTGDESPLVTIDRLTRALIEANDYIHAIETQPISGFKNIVSVINKALTHIRCVAIMGNMRDINLSDLITTVNCDEALLFVEEECFDIEQQLENASDEQTIGWARTAKASLNAGKHLKQLIQNRRGDIGREIKMKYQNAIQFKFVERCRLFLPPDQFNEIMDYVLKQARNEYSEDKK